MAHADSPEGTIEILEHTLDALRDGEPVTAFNVPAVLERALNELHAAWTMIESGWDIESREYFEKEAPRNGFRYPLAQAVHHMWKRQQKTRGLDSTPEAITVVLCVSCGARLDGWVWQSGLVPACAACLTASPSVTATIVPPEPAS